jgi:hypothetical protein
MLGDRTGAGAPEDVIEITSAMIIVAGNMTRASKEKTK